MIDDGAFSGVIGVRRPVESTFRLCPWFARMSHCEGLSGSTCTSVCDAPDDDGDSAMGISANRCLSFDLTISCISVNVILRDLMVRDFNYSNIRQVIIQILVAEAFVMLGINLPRPRLWHNLLLQVADAPFRLHVVTANSAFWRPLLL